MKTKKLGTLSYLDRVAENLYRHRETSAYWAVKKINGKKNIHSLGTTDRITANGKLREWLGELDKTDPKKPDLNLALLGEKFLAARAGKAVATVKAERRMWKAFRASFPRQMETLVARVAPSDIAAWLAKIKPGKRALTFNRWRLFVRELFALARMDAGIESPFLDELNPPAKKQKVERPVPTEDEFVKIIDEIRKPSWHSPKGQRGGQRPMLQPESADFAEFLGRAGVGQAEAAALRWEDLDDREMRFVRQKTGKEFRVFITEDLKPLLARRREQAGGTTASGPVFTVKNVKRALTTALRRLSLRHYSQRNFRSFKIVKMLDAGLDVKFVAAQQGHSDGGVLIMTTYSDVLRNRQHAYEDEQMARLNAAMAGNGR